MRKKQKIEWKIVNNQSWNKIVSPEMVNELHPNVMKSSLQLLNGNQIDQVLQSQVL